MLTKPATPTARPALALALILAAGPAPAEESFLDRLLGGSRESTPANPFASNYPSRPPDARAVRAHRSRVADPSEAADAPPVPPARIPR